MWFPNHWALDDGWTMKKNALRCKAIDSEVKQMYTMFEIERKKIIFLKKGKLRKKAGIWRDESWEMPTLKQGKDKGAANGNRGKIIRETKRS